MFIKDANGGYVNSDHVTGVYAEEVAPDWKLKVSVVDEGSDVFLSGAWPSQAAAQEAAKELFDGVDPASYGD